MVAELEVDLLEDGPDYNAVEDTLKQKIRAIESVAGVLAHPYGAI
jgi:hypothetical protein